MSALGWCSDQEELHIRSHFFLVTRGFPELVSAALGRLAGGWVLSSVHGAFPSFPRSVFSSVLVRQLHCSFIPGGPSLRCSLSPLTKSTI